MEGILLRLPVSLLPKCLAIKKPEIQLIKKKGPPMLMEADNVERPRSFFPLLDFSVRWNLLLTFNITIPNKFPVVMPCLC